MIKDSGKKSVVNFKHMENLYKDLIEDKGYIGLMPYLPVEKFIEILGVDETQKPTIKWEEFRSKLDAMVWVKTDPDKTKKRIDDLYKQANKFINTGQPGNAPELLQKANRLENVLSS